MNQRSLFSLLASCVLLTVNVLAHTHQTATKPSSDPPANLARTDYPDWPYPKGVHESPKPDDGQLFLIPGSTKSYTDTQINRSTSTVDWFPELHPAPPAAVISGKQGAYTACGQCHLIDGRGKPDTADLQGLPVAYFLQQLADMKDDKRHGSVPRATVNDMIPVAKALDDADAKLAARITFNAQGRKRVEQFSKPSNPGKSANRTSAPSAFAVDSTSTVTAFIRTYGSVLELTLPWAYSSTHDTGRSSGRSNFWN